MARSPHNNTGTVFGYKMAITSRYTNSSRRKYAPSAEMWPTQPHQHCCTRRGGENPLTNPATSHPHIYGASLRDKFRVVSRDESK
ncbi:hypothetical protein AVEN_187522-1 [Araneus ventricosus]|uniref:Uncharacterized protein n=1 Tax=Araneus ventricosus TaxID=182803 RepID=A0A4Y2BUQ6_ARAVE|nr:hypothetical protein AVEN_187522-1 [Araneus ventricosus]